MSQELALSFYYMLAVYNGLSCLSIWDEDGCILTMLFTFKPLQLFPSLHLPPMSTLLYFIQLNGLIQYTSIEPFHNAEKHHQITIKQDPNHIKDIRPGQLTVYGR